MAESMSYPRRIACARTARPASALAPGRALALVVVLLAAACILPAGAESGASAPGRGKAEAEYRLLQAELTLAESRKPYFVIDFPGATLQIRLAGVVVWSCPLAIADGGAGASFLAAFAGREGLVVRPLLGKHLRSFAHKSDESVVQVVSEVNRVNVARIQRDVPERLDLYWANDLALMIRSEVEGRPSDFAVRRAATALRRSWERCFGFAELVVDLEPDDALTLNRCLERGCPTLVLAP